MKITNRQLRRIIKEEAADCVKDYRLGTLSRQEYEDCLKRFEEPGDYGYSRRRYPPPKTSYVGADSNQDKIAAVQAAIAVKPNNFLQSVLSQLQRGRGLSRKQNAIVKKILIKTDPESAKLFEGNTMKITKNQLRRIIRQEQNLKESALDDPGGVSIPPAELIARLEKIMGLVTEVDGYLNSAIRGEYGSPDAAFDANGDVVHELKELLGELKGL